MALAKATRGAALAILAVVAAFAPAAAASGPAIAFDDQQTSGRIVLVDAVQLPRGGFVVMHDPSTGEGELGEVTGHSILLGAGRHTHVPVTLYQNLTEQRSLVAVLYEDSNDNRVPDLGHGHSHDHASQDEPFRDGDVPIGDRATVGPHSTETESSSTGTWLAGAAAAVASLVFWAVRVR